MEIEMKNIDKSFGSNQVLHHAGLFLEDGEIHALMGENGAGKSTLMKILTGVYTKDNGEIYVDHQLVNYKNPKEAEKAGIVFIHQELNVLRELSIVDNLFIGKEITKNNGLLDKKRMIEKSKVAMQRLGLTLDPNTLIKDLSVGQQQMIEICKALMVDAKVIIMDEPTAALTLKEIKVLFEIIKTLKKQGVSLIYISHRMEEIFEICDSVTILRDGNYIATKKIAETNVDEVVKMMIGRELTEQFPKRKPQFGNTKLEVVNLGKDKLFQDISFQVKEGEILGISGLMGAGRTEIVKTIFGALKKDRGEIFIDSKPVKIHNPSQAMALGIAFISEDRKNEGLMVDKSIKENISLTNFEKIIKVNRLIDKAKEEQLAKESISNLQIRCTGSNHLCQDLSGGNQQKVVLSKWIQRSPKILILDEPTRGVDVGAKAEIYLEINKLAQNKVAIIMISSDLPEILGMSDRVMVIHEGKIAGFLNREDANQEKIMTLATGGSL